MIRFIFNSAILLSVFGIILSENSHEALKRYAGKKYDGTPIDTRTVIGEVQCTLQCTNMGSACKSLTYTISSNTCRIYGAAVDYLSELDDDDNVVYFTRSNPRYISDDFVAYPKRNYPKGVLITVENLTFKMCVFKCKTTKECKSFTYYHKLKKCQLKTDWPGTVQHLVIEEDAAYFTKKEYSIPNYIVHMNKNLPGYKICRLDEVSLKQCAMECDNRKKTCWSFSYSPSERYCVLKSKKVRMMKRLKNDPKLNHYQRPSYYKLYKNTHYALSTLQIFDKLSVQECKYACELNPLCKGFTHKYDMLCELKGENPDKFANLKTNRNYHYYQKIDVEGYMIHPSYDYPLSDLDYVDTINPYICAKACQMNDRCKGFVIKKQRCTLKVKIGKDKEGWKTAPDSYLYMRMDEKKMMKLEGYMEFEDKTYAGHNLFWMKYEDKKECMEICKNLTTHCKGFVIYDEKCWFKKMAKNYGEDYTEKINAVLYIKKKTPKMIEGYEAYENKHYTGYEHSNYKFVEPMMMMQKSDDKLPGHGTDTDRKDKPDSATKKVKDIYECSRMCTKHKECKGFVIRLGKCWLKTQAEPTGPNFVDSKLSTLYLKKWRKCEY